jgi:hypothetical protein
MLSPESGQSSVEQGQILALPASGPPALMVAFVIGE